MDNKLEKIYQDYYKMNKHLNDYELPYDHEKDYLAKQATEYEYQLRQMEAHIAQYEAMQKEMQRKSLGRLIIQDSKLILIDRDEKEIELTDMSDPDGDSNIMAKIAKILLSQHA